LNVKFNFEYSYVAFSHLAGLYYAFYMPIAMSIRTLLWSPGNQYYRKKYSNG